MQAKKFLGFFVSLLSLSINAVPAVAEDHAQAPREICVTGRAEVAVVPDQIVWEIFIKDVHKDLTTAKHSNDIRALALLDTAEKLGIDKSDVRTDASAIDVQYDTDKDGNDRTIRNYSVTRNVTVLERDLTKYDQLFEALCTTARAEISITPQCSKLAEIELAARKKAVEDARSKAEVMANVAGAKLGKVLSISDSRRFGHFDPTVPAEFNLTGGLELDKKPVVRGNTFSVGNDTAQFQTEVRWELTD